MKAVGLITEYNPLHNGHIYHLLQAKKISGADIVIAVMSGNFVQRGEPAIIDKYARCEAAILSGINLVIELPAYYALSSAEGFAAGAIKTLHALQVESFVFGSECGDLSLLQEIASILVHEPESYRELLKCELSSGKSFPSARQAAISSYIQTIQTKSFETQQIEDVLSSPNNILGIEYIKASYKFAKQLKPYTIARKGAGYNETEIRDEIPSASGIRNELDGMQNSTSSSVAELNWLTDLIPAPMLEQMKKKHNYSSPIKADDFSMLLNYKLEQIFYENNYDKAACSLELSSYIDVSIDLANRIVECFDGTVSISEFIQRIKTKQYTYSRISRCLFHIILDMKKVNNTRYTSDLPPYIRILGFDEIGQKYLSHIKKKCEVPMITKTADKRDLLQDDIYISNLYNQVVYHKYHTTLKDEFRSGVYIKKSDHK